MKTLLATVFVLLVNTAIAQTDYSQNLISKAAVNFPVMPEYRSVNTGKNITNHYYSHKTDNNEWKVLVRDLTKNTSLKFRPQDIAEFYLTGVLSVTRPLNASLISFKEIEINGSKAIEFEYHYPGDQNKMIQTRQRIIYFNNVAVSMEFSSLNGKVSSDPGLEEFFNSFKIAGDPSVVRQYNLDAGAAKPKNNSGGALGGLIALGVVFGLGALIF